METQKFKVGDKVEWACDGNFVKHKGLHRAYYDTEYYDTGTVVEFDSSVDSVSIKWDSDGSVTERAVCNLRLLESKEEKEEPYISLTKDEVDEFLSTLEQLKVEYWTSDYALAKDFIDGLIKFKESKKELSEEQKKIQEALALLENSGYSCIKK